MPAIKCICQAMMHKPFFSRLSVLCTAVKRNGPFGQRVGGEREREKKKNEIKWATMGRRTGSELQEVDYILYRLFRRRPSLLSFFSRSARNFAAPPPPPPLRNLD